jgi:hypothetical protein
MRVDHICILIILIILSWLLIKYLTQPTMSSVVPSGTKLSSVRKEPLVNNNTGVDFLPLNVTSSGGSFMDTGLNCPQWVCPRCPNEEASFMAASYSDLYCPTPPECPPIQDGIGISCECGICSTARNGTIDGGTMVGVNSSQTLATETDTGAQSGQMALNTDLSETSTAMGNLNQIYSGLTPGYYIPTTTTTETVTVVTPSTNSYERFAPTPGISTTSLKPTILRNTSNAQCLQVNADENGGALRMETCGSPVAPSQQWYQESTSHIRNSGTSDDMGRNRCLDVNLGLPGDNGKVVDINRCGDGITDKWMQWNVGSNGTISSVADGRCLNYNDGVQKITVENCGSNTPIPSSMVWTYQ